jgi:hypothetical protein
MTPATLRDSLKKAGFQDIMILDSAYLVQAKNSDGDSVVMLINPPATMGAKPSRTSSTDGGSGATDGGPHQQSAPKAGQGEPSTSK